VVGIIKLHDGCQEWCHRKESKSCGDCKVISIVVKIFDDLITKIEKKGEES